MESSYLTDEEIFALAPEAQEFFARNFGGAPGSWSNEQVRSHELFRKAIQEIARAAESAVLKKLGEMR